MNTKVDEYIRRDHSLRKNILKSDEVEEQQSHLIEEIKTLISDLVGFLSNNSSSDEINDWLNEVLFSWKTILLIDFKEYIDLKLPIEFQALESNDDYIREIEEINRKDHMWKGRRLKKVETLSKAELEQSSVTINKKMILASKIENTLTPYEAILNQTISTN